MLKEGRDKFGKKLRGSQGKDGRLCNVRSSGAQELIVATVLW
jgi:hypothetical protein